MTEDLGTHHAAALDSTQVVAVLGQIARAAASRIDAAGLARTAIEGLRQLLRADGGCVYHVDGDELADLASVRPPDFPHLPARLPLAGSFYAQLLASPGARQWTPDEASDRVKALLDARGPLVIASAAAPSGGRSVALINVVRLRAEAMRPDELSLLATVAALIGPSLDLRTGERGLRKNSRELSVLHRIASAAGRTLELGAVVGTCVDLTREFTGADVVSLFLVDETGDRLTLLGGETIESDVELSSLPISAISHLELTPRPFIRPVDEIREPYRTACIAAGVRQTVTLPLIAGDALVGVLALAYRTEQSFDRSMLDTLVAMAEQQAVAIEFARGHQLSQMRARLSSVVREVAERALGATDDAETCDVLLDGAAQLCGSPSVRLALVDGAGRLVSRSGRNLPAELHTLPPLEPGDPFFRCVKEAGGPLIFGGPAQLDPCSLWGAAFRRTPLVSLVVIPLRLRGELIGVLASHAPAPRHFHAEEKAAMTLMASVAASAIETSRQRRRAEEQRLRLGQIVEHLPMPLIVLDPQGRFEQVNAAYRDLNPTAAVGKSWFTTMSALEVRTADGNLVETAQLSAARALRGEPTAPTDYRVKLASGAWRNLVTNVAVLRSESDAIAGVVAAVQDVTTLRELAAAKDRFIDMASHELRSPLSALRACTSLLELDPNAIHDEGRRRQLGGRILYQVDRLVALVDELVEAARIRSGPLRLSLSRFDLVEVGRETVELLQLQSKQHRIGLEASAPVEGTWDRPRIGQVITNLLSNAVRYSPEGGDIAIRVAEEGGDAVLSVEDHGIGITPEEKARLFEPYFRGPVAGEVARGGLGLGLHITMEIVRRHQGRIVVESQPGLGSRFTVILPRDAPA